MSINAYYRPGVYSEYDLSGVVYGGGRGGLVGLAAVNTAVFAAFAASAIATAIASADTVKHLSSLL